MKKGILISALVLVLAALLAAGTWAWFTASAESERKISAGTVEIEVDEHGFQNITDWVPDGSRTKKVSVKTLGSKCVYVRVSLTPVWGYEEEGTFVAEPALPVDNVTLNWNQTDWVCDGSWYYYKEILCAEDNETSLLLESVTLSGSATDNSYQGKTLQIAVNAEAVQASHEAYKDAWGLTALPGGVAEWSENQ